MTACFKGHVVGFYTSLISPADSTRSCHIDFSEHFYATAGGHGDKRKALIYVQREIQRDLWIEKRLESKGQFTPLR